MKIKEIKLRNIINFSDEIKMSFIDNIKYNASDFEESYFFDKNIKILSKLGIIGRNAAGKSTIIKNIKLIEEIINFSILDFFNMDFVIKIEKRIFKNVEKMKIKKNFDKNDIISTKNDFNEIANEILQLWNENIFYKQKWVDHFSNYAKDCGKKIEYELLVFDDVKNEDIFISIVLDPRKPEYQISINEEIFLVNLNEIFREIFPNKEFRKLLYFLDDKKTNLNKKFEYFDSYLEILNFFRRFLHKKQKFLLKLKEKLDKYNELIYVFNVDKLKHDFVYHNTYKQNNDFNKLLKYTNKSTKIEETKKKLLSWIKLADDSIIDLKYDSIKKVYTSFVNKNNQNIDLNQLSDGTIKWFFLFDILFMSPYEIIIFDEIETSLHPKLITALMLSFLKLKKQLLFTTHNPLVFYKKYRPNAIYYIDINENDEKELYRLSDILKIGNKHVISEMIKKEKFGLHPDINYICDFLDLIGESDEK